MKENGRYLNIGHLYEPDGTLHTHEKTHIFPAEAEWQTEEGDEMRVIDLPFAKSRIQYLLRGRDPRVLGRSNGAGSGDHPLPVVHVQGARVLASQALRPGPVRREPGLFRTLLHWWPAWRPLPDGWARSSILSPCDLLWTADGIVAQAEPNAEVVVRGEVDIDKLYENREAGAAPTYRDRRRRADLYTIVAVTRYGPRTLKLA